MGVPVKDRLVAAAYRLGWNLVCRLPRSMASAMFRLFADITWRRQGVSVQVLEGNLRRVLGEGVTGRELRAVSREAMRSYARYWLEVFRLPVLSERGLLDGTIANERVEEMLATLRGGRGVVVPLPHSGNWDAAGAWIIARGIRPITTVMERLEPATLYDQFVGFREGLGMEVLPATGGDSPFGVLARRLRAGGMVVLLCDRDVTGGGIEVEFFGEKALMMGGPAALAVQTGAALMPATLWYEGDRWGIHLHEEIRVPGEGDRWQKTAMMTQQIASVFERAIAEHPADWHMLQRVFTSDLDPERLAAARSRLNARRRPGGNGRPVTAEQRSGADVPSGE